MAIKRRTKLFEPVNPTKRHFTKWLKGKNGAWLSEGEPVVSTLNRIVNEAKTNVKFQSHYPDQLALAYGIKNDLVTFQPDKDERYTLVFLTPKGLEIVAKQKLTTCAFTGRAAR